MTLHRDDERRYRVVEHAARRTLELGSARPGGRARCSRAIRDASATPSRWSYDGERLVRVDRHRRARGEGRLEAGRGSPGSRCGRRAGSSSGSTTPTRRGVLRRGHRRLRLGRTSTSTTASAAWCGHAQERRPLPVRVRGQHRALQADLGAEGALRRRARAPTRPRRRRTEARSRGSTPGTTRASSRARRSPTGRPRGARLRRRRLPHRRDQRRRRGRAALVRRARQPDPLGRRRGQRHRVGVRRAIGR